MRHASLFSGIGGPEVAAAMLGWDNIFHCEINPFCRQVLEYWFPNSDSYEDITKTDFTKYRGQIDVLTGGFPCQPFSYAGKRGGQTDDRYLWPEMLRVIDEVRPMWVISENVNGITTMVESFEVTEMGSEPSIFDKGNGIHRYRSEQTFTIERICRDLESKGYSVQPMLISAAAVAAPHRRDRIFILAYDVADSKCSRLEESSNEGTESEIYGGKKKEREDGSTKQFGFSSTKGIRGIASNSDCKRRDKGNEHLESSFTDGKKSLCNGGEWDAADSKELLINGGQTRYGGDGIGQEISQLGGRDREDAAPTESQRGERCGTDNGAWGEEQEQSGRAGGESIARMLPGERWKGFPTVSPVHRGNDGLPFDVDNLTISFAKWRNESLKAYGNAIVPQVMYRIFQCIETSTFF